MFDPDPVPGNLFGQNVNAGETRREGLEVAARGRASVRASWFARGTLAGCHLPRRRGRGERRAAGSRQRLAAGFDVALWKALQLHLDALRVGSQVLDNDSRERGPGAACVHRGERQLALAGTPKVALFVEGRNLFDERYATRGIYAFDFGPASQSRSS